MWRQGSQVSMRVARGNASLLSSHGRGIGIQDALTRGSLEWNPEIPAFPGALPQRRVVWMWFGAIPGAFGPEGRDGPRQPSCDPQKSPDTPGSPEGNTEGPGTASSEPPLPS